MAGAIGLANRRPLRRRRAEIVPLGIVRANQPGTGAILSLTGEGAKMPIHFEDLDVVSRVDEGSSALIVPCTMCPAATVAVRERKPFLELFRGPLTSPPLERHIEALRSRLAGKGVRTEVFRSRLYHQWFLCMWTARRRAKLRRHAERHDALIVLGCDSATETVREAAAGIDCKVIEAMKVVGIMNAQLSVRLPGNVSFRSCKIVPLSGQTQAGGTIHGACQEPSLREQKLGRRESPPA
jgi:hypothetical protein